MGSSVAWFLSANDDFDGTVLVVERDPSYEFTSTARTNSCMRQQYSNELNIRISQFSADYVRNFRRWMGDDPEVPDLATHHFGYMYLAGDEQFAATLRASQGLQSSWGPATVIMTPRRDRRGVPLLQRRRHRLRQPQHRRRGLVRLGHDVRLVATQGPPSRRRVPDRRGHRPSIAPNGA